MAIRVFVKNKNRLIQTLLLNDLLISIGSAAEASVRLTDAQVAPEQAVIVNENGSALFINQSGGTIFNGAALEQGLQRELRDGDTISIGSYTLTFETNLSNAPRAAEVRIESEFSFADILNSLRNEEDEFYFEAANANDDKRRLIVSSSENFIVWNAAATELTLNGSSEAAADNALAIVRKDFSGVTIYPCGEESVFLNEILLEVGTRLRNGDRLSFSPRKAAANLIFREPAALLELHQTLPEDLISTAFESRQTAAFETQTETFSQITDNRLYFGYFSLTEIAIMIFSTVLTAVLTFILLDFS
jgi:hypothetical protein